MRSTIAVLLTLTLLAFAGCGGGGSAPRPLPGAPPATGYPAFSVDRFGADSATIDNRYLPLVPGAHHTYEGAEETVEISVSHLTKMVLGIECAIVIDRAYEDGELVEETADWYAQDRTGYVWYMGEASVEFEDGEPVGAAGSWEAGKDVAGLGTNAVAGILMPPDPRPGTDDYYQEFYEGEAEDEARVEARNVSITLADGSTHLCVRMREWTALEPGVEEFKYYAPKLGLVRAEHTDGSERIDLADHWEETDPGVGPADFPESTVIDNPWLPLVPGSSRTYEADTEDGKETIVVEVLYQVRTVMGIDCVVVRDTVRLEGVVIEDTRDWFAQDEDGNVWYMGEEVDNYEYDDDDNLLGINHEGAWEAGVDGAVPGIVMKARPRVGDSYRQEYLEGEAEDIGAVMDTSDAVSLPGFGTMNCLKTRDWTPLDPGSIEFKWYARGIGVVREQTGDGSETTDLVGSTNSDPLTGLQLELIDQPYARAVFTAHLPVSVRKVTLIGPDGRVVREEEFEELGGTDELEFESPAPTMDDLEDEWPEGSYILLAVTIDDEVRMGTVVLVY